MLLRLIRDRLLPLVFTLAYIPRQIATRLGLVRALVQISALGMCLVAGAAEPLPVPLQAMLIKKVASYDRALTGKALSVVVVYELESASEVAEVVKTLSAAGLKVATTKASAFNPPSDANIAFLMRSSETPGVMAECARRKILSVADGARAARLGNASLGFDRWDDARPRIVVHLGRMRAEGHEFAAALLNLAQTIR